MTPSLSALQFNTQSDPNLPPFRWSHPDTPYLRQLRETHDLETLVADARSDYVKVRALRRWVSERWSHDGRNEPSRNDPLTILEEAAGGDSFRCVKYSIVLSGALTALVSICVALPYLPVERDDACGE